MTVGKKFDKFIDGLKVEIQVEVMKITVSKFETVPKIRNDRGFPGTGSKSTNITQARNS